MGKSDHGTTYTYTAKLSTYILIQQNSQDSGRFPRPYHILAGIYGQPWGPGGRIYMKQLNGGCDPNLLSSEYGKYKTVKTDFIWLV